MKRTVLIGLGLAMFAATLLLLPQVDDTVKAQAGATPVATRLAIHWDKYFGLEQAEHPELIALYIDIEVRCDGDVPSAVAISQTLYLSGPALELGEGLFQGYDWDWGGWAPPPGMICVTWQRIRWEVPGAAGAILDGAPFARQVFGEYWPPDGEETQEDGDHFWYLGPFANGEWHDSCPGPPNCETPGPPPTEQPTLTPRPTYTPEPMPTCLPTPTCPPVWPTHTPYPTATFYPTSTPWPAQPPFS